VFRTVKKLPLSEGNFAKMERIVSGYPGFLRSYWKSARITVHEDNLLSLE